MCLEPFCRKKTVLDGVGWGFGVQHELCFVRPSRCYRAYYGEVRALGDRRGPDDNVVRRGLYVRPAPVGSSKSLGITVIPLVE